jgi:precorrin-8X/cobalt-precorrin-8 methylmutase
VSRAFDAIVIVDWSAAAEPRTGKDSIWIHVLADGVEQLTANPPTRAEASRILVDQLSDLMARNRRVLLGMDFALGYPKGLAELLAPGEANWRGLWKLLAASIVDGQDNTNNRFEVAAEFNKRLGGRGAFWGLPRGKDIDGLTPTKPVLTPDINGEPTLAELRMTEAHATGPQPVWKLTYAGAVGGQSLVGIPALWRLRNHPWVSEGMRIWPFETGLTLPDPTDTRVVVAEVYPSLVTRTAASGQVLDETQVRTLARRLWDLDGLNRLAPLFEGPTDLSQADREAITGEEGWILGIETGLSMAARDQSMPLLAAEDYIRDPSEIYRRSFATIEAEANLDLLPAPLRPVATRLIHACGMVDLVDDLIFDESVVAAGRAALAAGKPILVDAEMVSRGIIPGLMPKKNRVICMLNDPKVPHLARDMGTTRSAAAVELWRDVLDGAVVAIGNAPTALFRLLEILAEPGAPMPAAILGFPVGFVGAMESKDLLATEAKALGLPFLAVRGRRGGSAMAAAAVNALAKLEKGDLGDDPP